MNKCDVMIQSTLTREQVECASRREGVSHPVISVIEYNEPRIAQLHQAYQSIESNQEQQRYVRNNYGFLGDAFEEAGEFFLGPLDIVAICSKAVDVWPDNIYPRYGLARMIAPAYAIQGKPEHRGLARYFLETHEL